MPLNKKIILVFLSLLIPSITYAEFTLVTVHPHAVNQPSIIGKTISSLQAY